MPRYYRRRRTVVVRPKKKWASNMKLAGLTTAVPTQVLVENSLQAASPTPVIVKVGNFKVQGDAVITPGTTPIPIASLIVVVFYLPEGITLAGGTAQSVVEQHPEWILAWKQMDVAPIAVTGQGTCDAFSVSSRLKRNLNSGDRVCIGYILDANSAPNVTVTIRFTAQYWTCAN